MAFRNPGIQFSSPPAIPAANIGGPGQNLIVTATDGFISFKTLDGDDGVIELDGAAGTHILSDANISLVAPVVVLDEGPIIAATNDGDVIRSEDSATPLARLFMDDNGHVILSGGGTPGNGASLEIASDGTFLFAGTVGKLLQVLGDTTVIGATTELQLATPTQTTVGAAGGASAPPATPVGYLKARIGGSIRAIPFYNS